MDIKSIRCLYKVKWTDKSNVVIRFRWFGWLVMLLTMVKPNKNIISMVMYPGNILRLWIKLITLGMPSTTTYVVDGLAVGEHEFKDK